MRANTPLFDPRASARKSAIQEIWHFKLNDPSRHRAFSVRFHVLVSANGFRKLSEVWASAFARNPDTREVSKVALKQPFELGDFAPISADGSDGIRIGPCELTSTRTRGKLTAKGRTIEWDFRIDSALSSSFNLVPETLNRTGLVAHQAITVGEDLRFTGTTRIDGEASNWESAPGMQGHHFGNRSALSWAWGHCNAFTHESGAPDDTVFEGLTARTRIAGGIPSPRMASFYFRYKGQDHRFNSIWDSVQCRSQHSLNEWNFRAERGQLSFRGRLTAEYRDFAGLTFDDTDGSLIYCADSKLSEMTLLVYRSGKLESTLRAKHTASFQIASRTRNPYIPFLI